ncbi:OLC1v1022697C1 [Oldenlandia corymbosa var. corymbosa]|uniref:OLC1v1022697C1 n=1 Tax=Oldenlandia corymbosa var. corymbosa TaxID=529605 RepID=A0AAV1C011_OLDCO|nr:OLC1v1022697C1 [Oldenlandia corymbosa var. corymbosa]
MLTALADWKSFSLSSKLSGAYASCGDLNSAKLIFHKTGNPNIFAFNWMISGLTFHGHHEEAIVYFTLLQQSRIFCPNKFTFSYVLKACLGLMDVLKGMEFHCLVCKMGFDLDVSVGNALIGMYGKCGRIWDARKVFDEMFKKDVATWTSMICGYSSVGRIEDSAILFEQMTVKGVQPNEFTWNAMIAGFARRGDCDLAFAFFSRMHEEGLIPDLVTWNAMISGFVQSQRPAEAFQLFVNMLSSGLRPNQVTITGLLPACGMIGSINLGREIHGFIFRKELQVNAFVGSALVDVYSKCGSVKDAWNVFLSISCKNFASWNAMIRCYGNYGMPESAVQLFQRMQNEGIQPNEVTFTSILASCSHGGLVDKGLEIFKLMKESYGIEPAKEHYASVVDLLCRAGRMNEAYDIITDMEIGVTVSTVGAFLNGCLIHERRDLAEKMVQAVLLKKPGGLVTLSNIYAGEGDWDQVEKLRMLMKDEGVLTMPGSSSL